jgi:hypothetical protein
MGGLRTGLRALAGTLTKRGPGVATAIAPGDNPMESAGLLAMPLDRFVHEGQLVEVRVPWLEVTLWFVPEERDADMLGREGVDRGRVWTARELMAAMALQGRTPPTVLGLARAKYTIDGALVDVRSQSRTD